MASFRINFQAQTTGDHYIGYRTYNDPLNTYTVLTVNITGAVPQLAHVDIPVPGNLYCAYDGIAYTGYIIAACEDQTDANMDGIPDVAIQWTVNLLQQTDPCVKTNILCEASPILTINWTGATSGCTPVGGPYPVVFTEVTPGDEVQPASAEAFVDAGGALIVNIIDYGLYKAAPVVTIPAISGCSPALVITVVMDVCSEIDLTDYICAGHTELSGDTLYELPLGTDLELCADTTTLSGLPVGYLATSGDNCHCVSCENVHLKISGTGFITVSYQRCWDDDTFPTTLITRVINAPQLGAGFDLGCIVLDTLHMDASTLTGGGVVLQVSSSCT